MPPRAVNKTHRPAALPEGDVGFLRLPAILALFPIGESSWWRGVAEGRYPKPVKLSTRVSAWRISDVRKLLEAYARDGAAGVIGDGRHRNDLPRFDQAVSARVADRVDADASSEESGRAVPGGKRSRSRTS